MRLTDILLPTCIDARLKSLSRVAALSDLVDLMYASRAIESPQTVKTILFERENIRSSAIGHGLALPHAKIGGCRKPVLGVGKSIRPLDFGAHDGRPVHTVFLLVSPLERPDLHVQTLGTLVRALYDPAVRRKLADASNVRELMAAVPAASISDNLYDLLI